MWRPKPEEVALLSTRQADLNAVFLAQNAAFDKLFNVTRSSYDLLAKREILLARLWPDYKRTKVESALKDLHSDFTGCPKPADSPPPQYGNYTSSLSPQVNAALNAKKEAALCALAPKIKLEAILSELSLPKSNNMFVSMFTTLTRNIEVLELARYSTLGSVHLLKRVLDKRLLPVLDLELHAKCCIQLAREHQYHVKLVSEFEVFVKQRNDLLDFCGLEAPLTVHPMLPVCTLPNVTEPPANQKDVKMDEGDDSSAEEDELDEDERAVLAAKAHESLGDKATTASINNWLGVTLKSSSPSKTSSVPAPNNPIADSKSPGTGSAKPNGTSSNGTDSVTTTGRVSLDGPVTSAPNLTQQAEKERLNSSTQAPVGATLSAYHAADIVAMSSCKEPAPHSKMPDVRPVVDQTANKTTQPVADAKPAATNVGTASAKSSEEPSPMIQNQPAEEQQVGEKRRSGDYTSKPMCFCLPGQSSVDQADELSQCAKHPRKLHSTNASDIPPGSAVMESRLEGAGNGSVSDLLAVVDTQSDGLLTKAPCVNSSGMEVDPLPTNTARACASSPPKGAVVTTPAALLSKVVSASAAVAQEIRGVVDMDVDTAAANQGSGRNARSRAPAPCTPAMQTRHTRSSGFKG